MKGSLTVTFSELFKDTLKAHGIEWCYNHYVRKGKMEFWEFKIWVKTTWV